MRDDELVRKLRGAAPRPKELDDERFWAEFERDVARGIDAKPRRRWRAPMAAFGLAVAAAAAFLIIHTRVTPRPSNPMPGAIHNVAEEELLRGPGDATDLVGDLDLDELEAVDHHFKGGV
jgi:hypothetical protein